MKWALARIIVVLRQRQRRSQEEEHEWHLTEQAEMEKDIARRHGHGSDAESDGDGDGAGTCGRAFGFDDMAHAEVDDHESPRRRDEGEAILASQYEAVHEQEDESSPRKSNESQAILASQYEAEAMHEHQSMSDHSATPRRQPVRLEYVDSAEADEMNDDEEVLANGFEGNGEGRVGGPNNERSDYSGVEDDGGDSRDVTRPSALSQRRASVAFTDDARDGDVGLLIVDDDCDEDDADDLSPDGRAYGDGDDLLENDDDNAFEPGFAFAGDVDDVGDVAMASPLSPRLSRDSSSPHLSDVDDAKSEAAESFGLPAATPPELEQSDDRSSAEIPFRWCRIRGSEPAVAWPPPGMATGFDSRRVVAVLCPVEPPPSAARLQMLIERRAYGLGDRHAAGGDHTSLSLAVPPTGGVEPYFSDAAHAAGAPEHRTYGGMRLRARHIDDVALFDTAPSRCQEQTRVERRRRRKRKREQAEANLHQHRQRHGALDSGNAIHDDRREDAPALYHSDSSDDAEALEQFDQGHVYGSVEGLSCVSSLSAWQRAWQQRQQHHQHRQRQNVQSRQGREHTTRFAAGKRVWTPANRPPTRGAIERWLGLDHPRGAAPAGTLSETAAPRPAAPLPSGEQALPGDDQLRGTAERRRTASVTFKRCDATDEIADDGGDTRSPRGSASLEGHSHLDPASQSGRRSDGEGARPSFGIETAFGMADNEDDDDPDSLGIDSSAGGSGSQDTLFADSNTGKLVYTHVTSQPRPIINGRGDRPEGAAPPMDMPTPHRSNGDSQKASEDLEGARHMTPNDTPARDRDHVGAVRKIGLMMPLGASATAGGVDTPSAMRGSSRNALESQISVPSPTLRAAGGTSSADRGIDFRMDMPHGHQDGGSGRGDERRRATEDASYSASRSDRSSRLTPAAPLIPADSSGERLTLLSFELLTACRPHKLPNPQHDAVRAVCWCLIDTFSSDAESARHQVARGAVMVIGDDDPLAHSPPPPSGPAEDRPMAVEERGKREVAVELAQIATALGRGWSVQAVHDEEALFKALADLLAVRRCVVRDIHRLVPLLSRRTSSVGAVINASSSSLVRPGA